MKGFHLPSLKLFGVHHLATGFVIFLVYFIFTNLKFRGITSFYYGATIESADKILYHRIDAIVYIMIIVVPISKLLAACIYAIIRRLIKSKDNRRSAWLMSASGLPLSYLCLEDNLFILACNNGNIAVALWLAEKYPVNSYAAYLAAWEAKARPSFNDVVTAVDLQVEKTGRSFGNSATFLILAARECDLSSITSLLGNKGNNQSTEKDQAMLEACTLQSIQSEKYPFPSERHAAMAQILLNHGSCAKPGQWTGQVLRLALKSRPIFDEIILELGTKNIITDEKY